jgi:uncharacterized protein with HEPN domain
MWTDDGSAWDILTAARHIRAFVANLSRSQFDSDVLVQSAVLHQIIVLGEAVKRLSEEFRLAHPSIPWTQIAGMRDRCVHGYDNVELDRVWEVTQVHARQMVDYLERIVPKPPDSPETALES